MLYNSSRSKLPQKAVVKFVGNVSAVKEAMSTLSLDGHVPRNTLPSGICQLPCYLITLNMVSALFVFQNVSFLLIADPVATEAKAALSRLSLRDRYNQIVVKRVHFINSGSRL